MQKGSSEGLKWLVKPLEANQKEETNESETFAKIFRSPRKKKTAAARAQKSDWGSAKMLLNQTLMIT